MTKNKSSFAEKAIIGRAVKDACRKLAPRDQIKNPVMFLVYLSAVLTTALFIASLFGISDGLVSGGFILAVTVILWLTCLFSNFAEAIAEGRGKAQADTLRASRRDVTAHRLSDPAQYDAVTEVPGGSLKKGDYYIVHAGEQIPADGEVIEGAASVDESAITGESAPVIREAGGDRSAVTGGTTILSDWLVVRVTQEPGSSFLDKMIAMVEGANRKKTPNEIALQILLVALSMIFVLVTASLYSYSAFSAEQQGTVNPTSVTSLVALLICLAPTTIGALLSAIGIAGMSRLNQANVLAMSGRAIEAAGDTDVLLLDKTGTITLGNRQAVAFLPVDGVTEKELADAAQLSSLADETPEGRSIVVLAKEKFNIRGRELEDKDITFIPFTAQTRMSGVDYKGGQIRKGAAETVRKWVKSGGGNYSPQCEQLVNEVARQGGTPLVVARNYQILGVIHLKDIIKDGVKEKFADLRKMGIKTIMITGDNPVTAAAIAAEAGVDDFLAEATPATKLEMIRKFQNEGHLVAMTGDGTNDAPALAQADVAAWVLRNNKHAGATTDTLSSAKCLYLAIRANQQVYGVVGICAAGDPLDSFENSVLLSILGECAMALESIKNAREKEEAAILAKNEQLRANLLRAISHDLRTPLTSISGNASNLLSNDKKLDDATRTQIFTDIYDDSMWLINLVENLLAITRIDEGRVQLNRSMELMDEVITEALRHVNRRSKNHMIHVSSSDDFILVQIDARLIVQVIINLVDNAIKYTPEGSVIEIHSEKKNQWVVVSVSDNGPGISDEQKPRLFDMFYSGSNKVADSRRSLGLGLSLCKSIVSAHGGTISVSDNQPQGTVFTFTLPAGEVELHE